MMRNERKKGKKVDTKRLLMAMVIVGGLMVVWMFVFNRNEDKTDKESQKEKTARKTGKESKKSRRNQKGSSKAKRVKGGKHNQKDPKKRTTGNEATKTRRGQTGERRAVAGKETQNKRKTSQKKGVEQRNTAQDKKRTQTAQLKNVSERYKEVVTEIEGKLYRASFTSRGGVLRAFVLKKERYREEKKGGGLKQFNLVRTVRAENLPLKVTFHKSSFSLTEPQRWQAVRKKGKRWIAAKADDHLTEDENGYSFGYRWTDTRNKVTLIKVFRADPDKRYTLFMDVIVRNEGNKQIKERLTISIPSMDFGEKARSFFQPISLQREAICYVNEDVKVRTYSKIQGKEEGGCGGGCASCSCRRSQAESNSFAGSVAWAGIDEKYFLLAVAPLGFSGSAQCRFGALKTGRGGLMWTDLNFPQVKLDKGQSHVHRFVIYGGPKDVDLLAAVKPGGQELKLGESVDFGILWFLGKPMLWVMRFFHRFVGNWGIAIILVTILIKLLTLYWNTKSMRSMKEMQKLKPLMDELKEKYGDDKQRYQQEMANLWKRHKINPLGGCLPMIFQMPIYIAWYQALMASVELYRAPLFGWIGDLTSPDPYYIMPLVMGAAMFGQQRMTPTAQDNPQAKMMMYMMPIMFTFFMLFLPSGLTLYILVNVVLSMLHTWYLNHSQ